MKTKVARIPKPRKILLACLLVAILYPLVTKSITHALPPFTIGDLESLFISEHYRDDGALKRYGCTVGTFTDAGGNAAEVWNFFIGLGYQPHVVAAIIGNMQAESGVYPQQKYGDPIGQITTAEALAASVDINLDFKNGGKPWGVVQFNPPGKFINTLPNITDANILRNQLIFLDAQLKGQYGAIDAIFDSLNSKPDLKSALTEFALGYERFATRAQENTPSVQAELDKRMAFAEAALARFGTGGSATPPAEGTETGEPAETDGETAYVSSCAAASDGGGTVEGVAEEQVVTGGANFKRDVPGGNAADFVSWANNQAGTPFTGGDGDGGWRYSSVSGLQDFYKNTPGYIYVDAGSGPPLPGDTAFYIDPETGVMYVDIVISVNGDQMVVVGLDGSGNVVRSVKSTQPGANGLVGFGRRQPPASSGGGGGTVEGLNNPGGIFQNCAETENYTSAQLNAMGSGQYGAFMSDCFSEIADRPDNGESPQGQFRIICGVSHFAYDDPIVFPGQPGKAHLHMFWGNMKTNANSNFVRGDTANSILESGGSTCQGGIVNRSAYWAPAMLSGTGASTKVVMPRTIVLYYKSHRPDDVHPLPQGIQLLVGNIAPGGKAGTSFSASDALAWGCYNASTGLQEGKTNIIPGTNGSPACPDGQLINAVIQFPQCLAVNGAGQPVLTSSDFVSHTLMIDQNTPCPGSHPYRVPQISYLMYWANPPGNEEAGWRLSSDAGFDQPNVPNPGGSLHGDWLGGWHSGTIQAWIDGCFLLQHRNCSVGQTGQNGTNRQLKRFKGSLYDGQMDYTGPQYLDLVTSGGTAGGGGTGGGGATPTAPPSATCNGKKVVAVSPPGSNLGSLVNTGGNETACFQLANGNYSFGNIQPKSGQTFIGASTGGVQINGNGYENAFSGTASNVTISSMTFSNFNNSAGASLQEQAPIRGSAAVWSGSKANNWLIENISSHDNIAAGVFMGDNFTVRNSTFFNNGVTGIGGDSAIGGIIENNNIYHNGFNGATGAAQNGANIKVTQVDGTSTRLVIRGNTVSDADIGIWCDVACNGATIEGNNVSNHKSTGIFYEVSKNGIIRNNTVTNSSTWGDFLGAWNNGSIGIGESADMLIEGNTINGGVSAFTIRGTQRPASGESYLFNLTNPSRNFISQNITFRNNTVNGSRSLGASHESIGSGSINYNSITFSGNNYVNPGSITFWWNRQGMTYQAWQGAGRQ